MCLIHFQNASQPDTQRNYCIKELVETENNYVSALKMVMEVSQEIVDLFSYLSNLFSFFELIMSIYW